MKVGIPLLLVFVTHSSSHSSSPNSFESHNQVSIFRFLNKVPFADLLDNSYLEMAMNGALDGETRENLQQSHAASKVNLCALLLCLAYLRCSRVCSIL